MFHILFGLFCRAAVEAERFFVTQARGCSQKRPRVLRLRDASSAHGGSKRGAPARRCGLWNTHQGV